jgi:hypothetical protein
MDETIGYTKEKYFSISTKLKLPPRCPILKKCSRAIHSRHYLGFKVSGCETSFEDFLKTTGQTWPPDNAIQEIELVSCSRSDALCAIEDCCPEIPLFEERYLPPIFKQSAFGSATYFKESKRFESDAKHFSECPEFSEYLMATKTNDMKPIRKRSPISKSLRFEIYQRENFSCFYCKTHKDALPQGVTLTLDHKVPYSDGGDDSPQNLVAACSECNSGKSNKVVNGI